MLDAFPSWDIEVDFAAMSCKKKEKGRKKRKEGGIERSNLASPKKDGGKWTAQRLPLPRKCRDPWRGHSKSVNAIKLRMKAV
jgi:hypothetical protein